MVNKAPTNQGFRLTVDGKISHHSGCTKRGGGYFSNSAFSYPLSGAGCFHQQHLYKIGAKSQNEEAAEEGMNTLVTQWSIGFPPFHLDPAVWGVDSSTHETPEAVPIHQVYQCLQARCLRVHLELLVAEHSSFLPVVPVATKNVDKGMKGTFGEVKNIYISYDFCWWFQKGLSCFKITFISTLTMMDWQLENQWIRAFCVDWFKHIEHINVIRFISEHSPISQS